MTIEESMTNMEAEMFADISFLRQFPKIEELVSRRILDGDKAHRIALIVAAHRARHSR